MATTPASAGSLIGCVDGMAMGIGSGFMPAGITLVWGSPDNCLTGQTGSDIAYDVVGNRFYINDAGAAGGSEWTVLTT